MNEKTSEIVIMWALTGGSVIIMLIRLFMKLEKRRRLDTGDWFTIAAIVTLLGRSAIEQVPMLWGTNQTSAKARAKLTAQDIYRMEIGAKLTMVNRIFYTIYIWLQKCVVMCIVSHLLRGIDQYNILRIYWIILGATFSAAIIVCFTECHPFQLYWQVVPDPGTCGAGNLQLFVFTILEVVTDFGLMALPLRFLITIKRPWLSRLRIIGVFLIGTSIIAVSLTRLMMNITKYHRSGASHNIANVEILFAAVVANAPPIYGLINAKYGTSSQRSRENNYHNSGSNSRNLNGSRATEGRQLDTLATVGSSHRGQKSSFGQWANVSVTRKNGDTDSDEELIIQGTPTGPWSSTSSNGISRST